MFSWLKEETELQKLQKRYCRLMKNAYNLAIKDKNKSDQLHDEASRIMSRINKLEHQQL
ncbi:Lacal_2735 family protein [Aquimarina addita]|uniref:Lacal_2735 family protein n=1 Tax=Aquimarina addita TaxID=870485 RepID=UPI0031EC888C